MYVFTICSNGMLCFMYYLPFIYISKPGGIHDTVHTSKACRSNSDY